MWKRCTQRLERHAEKLVLTSCLLFMLVIGYRYLLRSPHRAEIFGESVTPANLYDSIAEQCDRLEDKLRSERPAAMPRFDYAARFTAAHNAGVLRDEHKDMSSVGLDLPRAASFGSSIDVPGLSDADGDLHNVVLVVPLAPTRPVLTAGRAIVRREPLPLGPFGESVATAKPESRETAWITVAAWFDKAAQVREFVDHGFAPFRSRAYITAVQAQRQELLASGDWSEWRDVPPGDAMPRPAFQPVEFDETTGALLDREPLGEAFAWVRSNQPALMQPPFYLVEVGDPWRLPQLAGLPIDEPTSEPASPKSPPMNAEQHRAALERIANARSALNHGDVNLARELASPLDRWSMAFEFVESPERPGLQAVWFHDDSVEAGRTVRYRLRVVLWNRYAGQVSALRDPQQARETQIAGEWSLPTDPITAPPRTHFYARGVRPDRGIAIFDVWCWRSGVWIRQAFEAGVGDVIGDVRSVKTSDLDPQSGKPVQSGVDFSTGAVVLDLRFDEEVRQRLPGKDGAFRYRDQCTLTVVYLDPADGQVKEKSMLADRYDATRESLEAQEL